MSKKVWIGIIVLLVVIGGIQKACQPEWYDARMNHAEDAMVDLETDITDAPPVLTREYLEGISKETFAYSKSVKAVNEIKPSEIGGRKGDERRAGDGLFVKDEDTYSRFYETLSEAVGRGFDLTVDHQKYHSTESAKHFLRKLPLRPDSNHIVMRIEWKQLLWSQKRLLLAREIARVANEAILGHPLPDPPAELKKKSIGYDGYDL